MKKETEVPWPERARTLARTGARTLRLVLAADRTLTIALVALTIAAGVLPAAVAWVGKQIVDGVMAAATSGLAADREEVVWWVLVELGLVVILRGAERGRWLVDTLLRAQLGQQVNERIIAKALTLSLADFEDSELYDRMVRARRGASYRPISVVLDVFEIGKHAVALVAYGALLWQLAPLALVLVALAAIPVFVVDTKFSEQTFRLFTWRAPETRKQNYMETVLTPRREREGGEALRPRARSSSNATSRSTPITTRRIGGGP